MNRFVFAIHRGGSSVLGGIAKNCALAAGEPAVVLGGSACAFAETGPEGAAMRVRGSDGAGKADGAGKVDAFAPQLANWQRHAGVFAPIRRADFFPPAFFRPGDRAVLNMRDPRDCMVSGYFGFLRLHNKGLDNTRRAAMYRRGIDEYVLDDLLERYALALDNYIALLARLPGIRVLTYEAMVGDFPAWFGEFCAALAFEAPVYERLVARQAAKFDPPAQEDIDQHKRQMLPGDYRRKLAPATIARIDARLERQLRHFGYR